MEIQIFWSLLESLPICKAIRVVLFINIGKESRVRSLLEGRSIGSPHKRRGCHIDCSPSFDKRKHYFYVEKQTDSAKIYCTAGMLENYFVIS